MPPSGLLATFEPFSFAASHLGSVCLCCVEVIKVLAEIKASMPPMIDARSKDSSAWYPLRSARNIRQCLITFSASCAIRLASSNRTYSPSWHCSISPRPVPPWSYRCIGSYRLMVKKPLTVHCSQARPASTQIFRVVSGLADWCVL